MRTQRLIFGLPISGSLVALAAAAMLTPLMGGCSVMPVYTVKVDNQSGRTIRATLERRPTINEVIEMDSARVKGGSAEILGPGEARPFERIYIVIGDRTDLHTLPESVELNRGQWIVTISPASMTSWGTYQLDVRKAKGGLETGEVDQTGGGDGGESD